MNIKYPSGGLANAVIRFLSLCLFFLISSCSPYYDQPPPHPAAPRSGDAVYNIEQLAPQLKLTRPQIQKIRQLRADFDKESSRINTSLRAAYSDLNNLIQEDRKQLNKDSIFKKVDEVNEFHAEMQRKIIELDLELTGLLTDEQYEKFRDIVSRRQKDY